MKIYIESSTAGRFGGGLKGNLTNFDQYIQKKLDEAGFRSSFDEFWLSLAYPPMYILPGVVGIEKEYKEYYDRFPYSRVNRRYRKIDVSLQCPEFSEHFDKEDQAGYQHRFDIDPKYKNISETSLAHILLDKYLEAVEIIRPKLKREDVFDFDIFERVINSIRKEINPDFLTTNTQQTSQESKEKLLENALADRLNRKATSKPATRLIRDIRTYFAYKLPENLFYLQRCADAVLRQLIDQQLMCPVYDHLYISIASTREEALIRSTALAEWHIYGITVLPEEELLNASPKEQQKLMVNALREGLLDIANLDGLDKSKILTAIRYVQKNGFLNETIFKSKENRRILFSISTRPIVGKNKDEIFFTLKDKETGRTATWKFGEENIFLIQGWFGTINVTNKKITTKPRANMDLVLEGKEKELTINVEDILDTFH